MFDFKLLKIDKLITDFKLSLFFTSIETLYKMAGVVCILSEVYSGTADCNSI